MLDKLDGRLPVQDGIQPMPPVSEITPPNAAPTANAIATTVPAASDSDTIKLEGNADMNTSSASAGAVTSPVVGGAAIGNTIGQLQELCVHKGLPMPIYDLDSVDGQPHMRQFAMTVRVGNIRERGEGTSKKDAKRDAAAKMVATINGRAATGDTKDKDASAAAAASDSSPGETAAPAEISKEDEELAKKVENMKIEPLTKRHSVKIQQFYQNLQESSAGSKLFLLHRTSLKSGAHGQNHVRLLSELATEQKFEVTHVEIEEKTDEGEIQCLVQLSSLPVAVCYGTGKDMEAAKQSAARNALNYLKMMTKKSVTATGANGAATAANGK